ncbi:MAG: type II toxin-antitoxin system HicB family antitoxin [Eubacteriales bacterium]|nr:type II toxin-antitoxin system HicB family antitoxin [Eubacteriales bacterium]
MNEYVYPGIFSMNDDGSYTVTFPDLEGCITEGKTLKEALKMAQSALTQWIEYLNDNKLDIPRASEQTAISVEPNEFINLVYADIRDNKAVKRTLSIPKWMDDKASEAGLSLSKVLQEALRNKFD